MPTPKQPQAKQKQPTPAKSTGDTSRNAQKQSGFSQLSQRWDRHR